MRDGGLVTALLVVASLLAAPYELPPGAPLPPPDAGQRARIERALAALRGDDEAAIRVAVRDLSLLGDAALPAIVGRLGAAEAGERILLLLALDRNPRAAPLFAAAGSDPDPAVRALVAPPVAAPPRTLEERAARYLESLQLAEDHLRREFLEATRGVPPPWKERDFSLFRPRLEDRTLAAEVQRERTVAAIDFAERASIALLRRDLAPDPRDPRFRLFVTLLGEEALPFYFAVSGLARLGDDAAAPVEALLLSGAGDAGVLARLLVAMRSDGGAGLYGRLDSCPPNVRELLLDLAPAAGEMEPVAARAFAAGPARVRVAALDLLLRMPAPAGADLARSALAAGAPDTEEMARLFRLLARAGRPEDLETLAGWAETEIEERPEPALESRRRMRGAAIASLHEHPGAPGAARRWVGSAETRLRTLAVGLLEDAGELARFAAAEPDPDLAATAMRRALEKGADPEAAAEFLRARPEARPESLLQQLRLAGAAGPLVRLATEVERLRRGALEELSLVPSLDARFEPALLALHDAAEGPARRAALAALLPLGTEAVRDRVVAAGIDALEALARRGRAGLRIEFRVPLLALLPHLDASGRKAAEEAAAALRDPEPGVFCALLAALDATPATDPSEEEQRATRRRRIGDDLALSTDVASTEALFARLLSGEAKSPSLLFPTFKAAARLLPSDRLFALAPMLERAAAEERARPDRTAPVYSEQRHALLLGGVRALAHARAEGAPGLFCRFLLDPLLQPGACVDPRASSDLPKWALDGLRLFPADACDRALRAALRTMEDSGDLARIHPDDLLDLAAYCHQAEDRGRRLFEVALALCEVVARVPGANDVALQRARALIGLGRRGEAAASLRLFAEERLRFGAPGEEGWFSPDRLRRRAALYEAVEARDVAKVFEACGDDPELQNAGASSLFFQAISVGDAEKLARSAVRLTATMHPGHRMTLAGILASSGRPAEALDLLEARAFLRERLRASEGWQSLWRAKAYCLLGRREQAETQLVTALLADRSIDSYARADPALQPIAAAFRKADEAFFDSLFSWEE